MLSKNKMAVTGIWNVLYVLLMKIFCRLNFKKSFCDIYNVKISDYYIYYYYYYYLFIYFVILFIYFIFYFLNSE